MPSLVLVRGGGRLALVRWWGRGGERAVGHGAGQGIVCCVWELCGVIRHAGGVGAPEGEWVWDSWDAANEDSDTVRWIPALHMMSWNKTPAMAESRCCHSCVRRWEFLYELDGPGSSDAGVERVDAWPSDHVVRNVVVMHLSNNGVSPGPHPVYEGHGARRYIVR